MGKSKPKQEPEVKQFTHPEAEAMLQAAFADVPGVTVRISTLDTESYAKGFSVGFEEAVSQMHDHPDAYTFDCEDCPPDLDKILAPDRVALALEIVFWEVDWRAIPVVKMGEFVRRIREGLLSDGKPEAATGSAGEPDQDEGILVSGDGGRAGTDGAGSPDQE